MGLTKATHGSAREGGASRDSPMHQRDARRTRHHTPVTPISRRLHDAFERDSHTHDQEPIDDYHTTYYAINVTTGTLACRPHLSQNVLRQIPTEGVTSSTHTTYMEAATHMSAAQGGG